jgi:hypothetical protein
MHITLLLARGDFADIATIVIVIVVGVIRFLYSIMKKPDVPPGAPPQNAPQTPEALQQEIEKFIRQAQGREARPAPVEKPIIVEQRPPEPIRQLLPAEERKAAKQREQNRPKPKKSPRPETRAPELAPTALSKRHVIDNEVQQTLGSDRPQRRSEKPVTASIEQHMQSVFAHKVGTLDSDVDNRSVSSISTTTGKQTTGLKFTRDQIRQAIVLNEILTRPNFDR